MTGAELKALFNEYCDETDETFLTSANVTTYLKIGYREFRNFINQHDPFAYATTADITPGAVSEYDLSAAANAVRLLGSNRTQYGMSRLLKIGAVDGSDSTKINWYLQGVQSRQALQDNESSYFLQGSTVFFSNDLASNLVLRFFYVPMSDLDVTVTFIDDFEEWHDIIAMMAYKHYAIRDAADNVVLVNALNARLAQFAEYLQAGRVVEMNNFVSYVDDN